MTPNLALQRALTASGVRKDWFAAQLGIHPSLLSHYLAGRRTPPERFYREAALLLRVPVESITPAPAAEALAA